MNLYKPLQPGDPRHLGRYELLGRLGEGGMGVVFLGQDELGLAAIKTIKSMNADDHRAMRRFRREVEAAKRVPRYCTAQVYGYDFEHDPPFIVSEYVKGPTLRAEVGEKGPLSASDLHGVAIGMAGALSEIHLAEVVHGDLTPSNVLLSLHGPRVIDFGIARVPEQTATSGRHIIGTPAYMAPERFARRQMTAAADVFAWGGVLAFAGTERPPFGQGSLSEIAFRIIHERPDLDGLDAIVRPLVEAALQKDPHERPTATLLQDELKRSARTAHANQLRTVAVEKVLESARQGSDRQLPTVRASEPPDVPGMVGFPRVLTGSMLLLASMVLALGVWVHILGGLGSFTNALARWLLGYGAYVLPLLVVWWAAAVLLSPRTVALWPQGREALWERSASSVLRAAGSTIRTMTHSPTIGGVVAMLLGGLGLLHLARGAPPIRATPHELAESGGQVSALLVGMLNPLLSPWIARLILALVLVGGATAVAWPIHRRWGMWPATTVLVLCLVVAISPILYLKDNRYEHWVKLDASNQLAVFRGLAVQRARMVERTSFTKDDVPAELRSQLSQGIPAEDLQDARRLASAIPVAYDRLAIPQSFTSGGTTLSDGTCLERADRNAPTVPCTRPHGAEVYGAVESPYHRFPGQPALTEFGEGACRALFAPYLGISREQSMVEFTQLTPTPADWAAGAQALACLLKPWPAREVQRSLRGSRQIFADDFSSEDQWSADTDNGRRCAQPAYPGDETLSLAKGSPGFFDRKQAGLLCVATPVAGSLDPELVTDVQLSVTADADPGAPAADRVGFSCREGNRSRYHLTVARDGFYAIEKVRDGQLIRLQADTNPGVIPATGPIPLRAVCRGGQDGTPVKLALWANGKLVGRATDAGEALPSGTVGVAIVAADPDPFSTVFDDFVAAVSATS